MSRIVAVILALVFVMLASFSASATFLIVQDVNPWGSTANQNTLTSLGISYSIQNYASVNWSNLSGYKCLLLVGSDGNSSYYNQYAVPNMSAIEAYVAAGNLVIIHYAEWEDANLNYVAPGGVGYVRQLTNNAGVAPGYSGPMINGGVNDANLSNWNYSSHGYLTNLVPGTTTVFLDKDTDEPIYVQYTYGSGQVFLTGMTLEWGLSNPQVLLNELTMAKNFCVVPIPGALVLLGSGLLGLIGLGLKQK